jgi:heptosyltransferase-2
VRLGGGGATVLAGQTDLAALVAVIDRLALLVANDSAPMHVACARGVPVVAVFCSTTPALGYGPWGERARVVEVDLACRPCARHGGPICPRGTGDCQQLVRPESVLAAARALLASPRTAGSAA